MEKIIMISNLKIKKISAIEILDSRGFPTIMSTVQLSDNTVASAKVPSGASTGKYEACELRDDDMSRYKGKGVLKAVNNVNTIINDILMDKNPLDICLIDKIMIETDGTKDKSNLGANAILSVSMAVCKACAKSLRIPLYSFLGGANASVMPVPMMNILNGGAHASNNIDIQEFMIMPVGAGSFKEALRWCSEVFHTLGKILKSENLSVSVGDEGGFAPNLENDDMAIEYILRAIEKAGYKPEKDFMIALDSASSEWKGKSRGEYILPKSKNTFNSFELINYWQKLAEKYPIYSIEDPLDEEDINGWKMITSEMGKKIQLVGDDLFVTNVKRLENGIKENYANSILIKLNQIGTVSETLNSIRLAQKYGYNAIISHRSGETEDTFIADLAVAVNAGQIKSGSPCRGERTAKYNRLLQIENQLKESAVYPRLYQ
jgi:enolase